MPCTITPSPKQGKPRAGQALALALLLAVASCACSQPPREGQSSQSAPPAEEQGAQFPARIVQGRVVCGELSFRPFGLAFSPQALLRLDDPGAVLERFVGQGVRMVLCEGAPEELLALCDEAGLLVIDPARKADARLSQAHPSLVPAASAQLEAAVRRVYAADPLACPLGFVLLPQSLAPAADLASLPTGEPWLAELRAAVAAEKLLQARAGLSAERPFFVSLDGPRSTLLFSELPPALAYALQPLALAIAGAPKAAFCNAPLSLRLLVINDTGAKQQLSLNIAANGEEIGAWGEALVPPGGVAALPVSLRAPEGAAQLTISVLAEGAECAAACERQVRLFPRPGSWPKLALSALVCPEDGATTLLLEQAGINATPQGLTPIIPPAPPPGAGQHGARQVLVVGEGTAHRLAEADAQRLWQSIFAGARAVVLKQSVAGWRRLLAPVGLAPEKLVPAAVPFAERGAGELGQLALALCRAAGGAELRALPAQLPASCRAFPEPLVSCCARGAGGEALPGMLLASVAYGEGLALLCQVPVAVLAPRVPTSLTLLRELVQHAAAWTPKSPPRIPTLGWETTTALRSLGLAADNVISLAEPMPEQPLLAVSGARLAQWPEPYLQSERGAQLVRFAERGSVVLIFDPPLGELGAGKIHLAPRRGTLSEPEFSSLAAQMFSATSAPDWLGTPYNAALDRFQASDAPLLIQRTARGVDVLGAWVEIGNGKVIVLSAPRVQTDSPRERWLARRALRSLASFFLSPSS